MTDFQTLKRRVAEAQREHQRLVGRKQEANRVYDELKQKCLARNIDPENLEETIKKLEAEIAKMNTELDKALKVVEDEIADITSEVNR